MMNTQEVILGMLDEGWSEIPPACRAQLSPRDIQIVQDFFAEQNSAVIDPEHPEQMQAEKLCGELHHQEQLKKLRGEIPADFNQVGSPRPSGSVGGDYPGSRSIRGDGNCYYRAIMYRLLEQVILIEARADKTRVLERLIGRVRQAAKRINAGILDLHLQRTVEGNQRTFDRDFYVGKLQSVIKKLDNVLHGHIWNSVENFLEDMRDENSRTDSELVQTARILTALSLLDVPDLAEGIVSEDDILDIIMMYKYAEGAAVESCVLPKFLGIDCVIKNQGMQDIIGDATERDKLDNARSFKVILKLESQHYDLLYTAEEYRALPDAIAINSWKRNLFFAASGVAGLGLVEYGIYAAMIAKNVVLSSVSVMIAFAGPLLIAALGVIAYLLIKHCQLDTSLPKGSVAPN